MMPSTSTNIKAAAIFAIILARLGWNELDFDPDVNGIQTGPKVSLLALMLSKLTPNMIRAALAIGYVLLCVTLKFSGSPISVAIKSTLIYAVLAARIANPDIQEAPAFFASGENSQELSLLVLGGTMLLVAVYQLPLIMHCLNAISKSLKENGLNGSIKLVLKETGTNAVDVAKGAIILAMLGYRFVTREGSAAGAFFATGAGIKSAPLVFNIMGGCAFVVFAAIATRLDQHRGIKALESIGFFSMDNLMKFTLVAAVMIVRGATRASTDTPKFFLPSANAITPPALLINVAAGFGFVMFAAVACRLEEHRSIKALSNIGFFTPINLIKFAVVALILGMRLATRSAAQDSASFFNPNPTEALREAGLFNGAAGLAFVGFAGKMGRASEWHPLLHDRAASRVKVE